MDEEQAFIWNNRWVNCKHQFHATAGEKVNSNAVVERLRWLDQRSSLRALLPEGTAAQQEMFASRMPAFPKSAWGIVEALGNDKKEERWRNQRRSHLLELEKQIKAARAKQKAEEDAARELELKRETESSRLFAYSGTGYASPPKSSKDAWRGVTNAGMLIKALERRKCLYELTSPRRCSGLSLILAGGPTLGEENLQALHAEDPQTASKDVPQALRRQGARVCLGHEAHFFISAQGGIARSAQH